MREAKSLVNEAEDRRERMQRIRVGLTGLAMILLLVLLATAFFTQINKTAGPAVAGAAKDGSEPLSDLGVVPRAPDNSTSAPANAQPQGLPQPTPETAN